MKFYAVKTGRKTGIFESWDECCQSVQGYSGAIYKSFKTYSEASEFLGSAAQAESGRETQLPGDGEKSSAGDSPKTVPPRKKGALKKDAPEEDSSKDNAMENNLSKVDLSADDDSVEDSEEEGELKKNGRKKSYFPQICNSEEIGRVDDYVLTESAKAYVDGSYLEATAEFSYGCVVLFGDTEFRFYEKMADPELAAMHNVAGEIKGAEAAMRFAIANGITDLTIYHDYEGIARWCTGEWTPKKNGTIAYSNFYQNLPKDLRVRFEKVQGHSGDTCNELADRLAKFALGIAE